MRTWPPGLSWYSSDRAQFTASGPQRGTVTAMVPPGRSTRASSVIAATSSGMCSSTSDAMTRSKVASANGSASASPCTAAAGWSAANSPASTIAPSVPRTWATSSGPASSATTEAPRRAASNACRPNPQPRSRSRSPGLHPELVVVHCQHATISSRRDACSHDRRGRRAHRAAALRPAGPR